MVSQSKNFQYYFTNETELFFFTEISYEKQKTFSQ